MDDAVYHRRRKDVISLIGRALRLQAVGRGSTAVRQLAQLSQTGSMSRIIDVTIDKRLLRHFQGVLHLKAMTTGHTERRDILVDIG